MIVSPNDMCDAHQRVVNYNREIIGGIPIRTEDNEIVQDIVIKNDLSLDEIIDYSLTFLRCFESKRCLRRRIGDPEIPATAIVPRRQTLGFRFSPAGFQFLCLANAPVGVCPPQQLHSMVSIYIHSLHLSN